MARPTDTYTHAQFELIQNANSKEAARCIHCQRWQCSRKVLNRKKAHLAACSKYGQWRAAGNGQELAPPNPYKSARRVRRDSVVSREGSDSVPHPGLTPSMAQCQQSPDVQQYFAQAIDNSLGPSPRARCPGCGFATKNLVQQAEHHAHCELFRATTEGSQLLSMIALPPNNDRDQQNPPLWTQGNGSDFNSGNTRPGPIEQPPDSVRTHPAASARSHRRPTPDGASLTGHLLLLARSSIDAATKHPFLSQAGCGSLAPQNLNEWLTQIGFVSRALVTFTGAVIAKIRISETSNLRQDPNFRCLDLLCSAVNSTKMELEFLEATKRTYKLEVSPDEPKVATKGMADLFSSASSASSTLLEGMVAFWAIEHLFHTSFVFAGSCVNNTGSDLQQDPYSLPSYLELELSSSMPWAAPNNVKDGHATALRAAFIEHWTSDRFSHFVRVCKIIVDELAVALSVSPSDLQMRSCERVFKQIIWLWAQIFPEVTGGGEPSGMERSRK